MESSLQKNVKAITCMADRTRGYRNTILQQYDDSSSVELDKGAPPNKASIAPKQRAPFESIPNWPTILRGTVSPIILGTAHPNTPVANPQMSLPTQITSATSIILRPTAIASTALKRSMAFRLPYQMNLLPASDPIPAPRIPIALIIVLFRSQSD